MTVVAAVTAVMVGGGEPAFPPPLSRAVCHGTAPSLAGSSKAAPSVPMLQMEEPRLSAAEVTGTAPGVWSRPTLMLFGPLF